MSLHIMTEDKRRETDFESAMNVIKVWTKKINGRRVSVTEEEKKYVINFVNNKITGRYTRVTEKQKDLVKKALSEFEKLS